MNDVQAKLLYSPEGKMRTELASVTDGYSIILEPRGFVAEMAEGLNGNRLRIRI